MLRAIVKYKKLFFQSNFVLEMSDGIDNPIGSKHFRLIKVIHLLLMIAVKSNLNVLN